MFQQLILTLCMRLNFTEPLKFTYMTPEFQKAGKQRTGKPIVDYFQSVCDATFMHENLSRQGKPGSLGMGVSPGNSTLLPSGCPWENLAGKSHLIKV